MFNKIEKNALIGRIAFMLAFLAIFLMIDLISKQIVFNFGKQGTTHQISWGIIGWRSLAHNNSTIFSAFNFYVPFWVRHILTVVLSLIFISIGLYTKTRLGIISIALILSGILGNGIDNMIFKYVRDIIYIPWLDNGTFNFADIFIICGCSLWGIITIIAIWKK